MRSATTTETQQIEGNSGHTATSLGPRVAHARQRGGLTLAALAARTELSAAYLSQIESGTANPTLRTLERLADALGSDVAGLFGDVEISAHGPFRAYASPAPLAVRQSDGAGIWDLTAADSSRLTARLIQGSPVGHTAPTAHPGEEFVLVLHGSCTLHVGSTRHALRVGDSCHFGSSDPHYFTATTPDLTLCVVLSQT